MRSWLWWFPWCPGSASETLHHLSCHHRPQLVESVGASALGSLVDVEIDHLKLEFHCVTFSFRNNLVSEYMQVLYSSYSIHTTTLSKPTLECYSLWLSLSCGLQLRAQSVPECALEWNTVGWLGQKDYRWSWYHRQGFSHDSAWGVRDLHRCKSHWNLVTSEDPRQ